MNYVGRPAWRNQWFVLTVKVVLLVLAVFLAIESVRDPARADLLLIGAATAGVAFVVLLVVAFYRRYSWKYSISNDTIESRHGIIARDISFIRVKDLRGVSINQSLFQRLFRLGDINFSSAADPGSEVTFHGVSGPLKIKEKVQTLQGGR
ncbi:MAG: PH domain-containing protein [Acidiferrobacterales bacterium]